MPGEIRINRTNILHITDLHLDPTSAVASQVTAPFGPSLVDQLSTRDWKSLFLQNVKQLLGTVKIDIVACTGDLSNSGDKSGIKLGLEYLAEIAKDLNVPACNVFVSPGNHEIERYTGSGAELATFCQECKDKQFSYVGADSDPIIMPINDMYIIGLNTCLGGNAHAISGFPEDFRKLNLDELRDLETKYKGDKYLSQIPDGYHFQFTAMDIPGIGRQQRESVSTALNNMRGNCAVLFMHHNPIPTQMTVFRPYAFPLDIGVFIGQLISNGRYVIILHGHTHCKSGMSVYPHDFDNNLDNGGFLACIGNAGLSGKPNDAATFIQIVTSSTNEFVKANIYSIIRNASVYDKKFEYTLRERAIKFPQTGWDWNKIPKNVTCSFNQVAEKVGVSPSESLAIDLLRYDGLNLKVFGTEDPLPENWKIERLY